MGSPRVDGVSDQSNTQHFDVIVLGAGPGGYVAAIRARPCRSIGH